MVQSDVCRITGVTYICHLPHNWITFESVIFWLCPDPASCTIGTGSFPGLKRPGRGVDQPSHPAPKLKKEKISFLYSSCGPSWPCTRVNNFTFPFLTTVRCNVRCTDSFTFVKTGLKNIRPRSHKAHVWGSVVRSKHSEVPYELLSFREAQDWQRQTIFHKKIKRYKAW